MITILTKDIDRAVKIAWILFLMFMFAPPPQGSKPGVPEEGCGCVTKPIVYNYNTNNAASK